MAADNQELSQQEDYEIDISELFARILSSWKLVTFFTVLFGAGALLITFFFITPTYQAKSTIYVLSRKDSALNISDLQIGASLTQDYVQVFNMWEVHEEVLTKLDLPYTYEQISQMVNVSNVNNTRMLEIAVTSTDPQEAADIANEYAAVSCDFIADTMSTDKPNVVSAALVPTKPIAPSKSRNTIIGALVGMMISIAIVVIRMLRDDKIKTADDVRKYANLTTLAIIPLDDISSRGSSSDDNSDDNSDSSK